MANGKRVAIVQSSYIPWKGYFDIIGMVDEFIFYDEVQFTRRDWRNRNKIKTAQGSQWLTIPVASKGAFLQTIEETAIAAPWADKHKRAIALNYARAAGFKAMWPAIEALFDRVADSPFLAPVNRTLTAGLCELLDIRTRLSRSVDYPSQGSRTDRLLSLCLAAGATTYLSGPSAAAYLEVDKFLAHGIAVEWMDYSGYPPYPQAGPFDHGVSIIDLLLNTGREARRHMKC